MCYHYYKCEKQVEFVCCSTEREFWSIWSIWL